jgi:hypothetical protein
VNTAERIVLVPGVLALLPKYAGLEDPVPELRSACLSAVAWLVETGPVTIVGDRQGRRVGEWLVEEARVSTRSLRSPLDQRAGVLAVGNGSACRTEKAPGYLDERAAGFDGDLARALTAPDPTALTGIDPTTSTELLAATDGLRALGDLLTHQHVATVDYDDDPFGVQYWVVRWTARLP